MRKKIRNKIEKIYQKNKDQKIFELSQMVFNWLEEMKHGFKLSDDIKEYIDNFETILKIKTHKIYKKNNEDLLIAA